MNSKLVSVIIPTYNRENTIKACLESVLQQTYTNIEVIVVDDCSQDNTCDVVKEIKDSRLHYYKLDKNRRACYARNYGFEHSNGEYIAFQDSDDIWHKDKIQKQINYLENKKYDFVFCGMNRITDEGTFYFPVQRVDVNHDFFYQELLLNSISTQTMFMKRCVIDQVRFDVNFKRFQDWDFAIRVAEKFSIGYLEEALVDSFIQNNSVTATIRNYEPFLCLYNKYQSVIDTKPLIKATYLYKLGDFVRIDDPAKASDYYWNSLRSKFDYRVFVKFCLSKMGIRF